MRLLLDSCMAPRAVNALQEAGHDVDYVGDWPADPGDVEILAYAYSQRRVVITLDKDFGEHAVANQLPHAGLVRLVNFSVNVQGQACVHIVEKYGQELEGGALVTAEPGYVRIRPPS